MIIHNGAENRVWRNVWQWELSLYCYPLVVKNKYWDSGANLTAFKTSANQWDLHHLKGVFSQELIQEFVAAVPSFDDEPDTLYWLASFNGLYSMKSGYHIAMRTNATTRESAGGWIWIKNILVLPRTRAFIWKWPINRLPTKDNLVKRKILEEDQISCSLCNRAPESRSHLLTMECLDLMRKWVASFNGC